MQTSSQDERAPFVHESIPVDGRTARRDRNRNSVLEAVLELFEEGKLSPGVHEIAHRSGVSLRSVYRYFDDVDDLIAAAIDRQYDIARPLFLLSGLGQGPLLDRIERFCAARVRLFESVRTVHIAATARERLDPRIAEAMDRCREQLSRQTAAMFAPELGQMADDTAQVVGVTLDILTQLETIELLRGTRGLTVEGAVQYLRDTFDDMLT
ncbi:TetR/AcrR family transcriptional regulator [Actinospongicola halichondriae]|uniref:TetR/AcrR family transcriptional regulator n=1 Tax=Actinospongicola halichondriae TaxID=3236844 RepID=UPI003D577A69